MLKLYAMDKGAKGVFEMIKEEQEYRSKARYRVIIFIKMTMKFNWINKKFGGFNHKIKSRLRHFITLGGAS